MTTGQIYLCEKDGRVFTRHSKTHTYTHAVYCPPGPKFPSDQHPAPEGGIVAWCGSLEFAQKRVKEYHGKTWGWTIPLQILPVTS